MAVTTYQFPSTTHSSSNVTTPNNAFSEDGLNADFPDTGGTEAIYGNFNLVPGGKILGIEVEIKAAVAGAGNFARLVGALSYDSGSNYAPTTKNFETNSDTFVLLTQGGPTDLWGRTWTPQEFANSIFRARLQVDTGFSATQISIDYIKVRVYYQVSGMIPFF